MRNPQNDDLRASENASRTSRSGRASSPAARARGRADPARARRPTARSRPTSAPARRAAAPGSASTAPSSTRPTPRASSRARCSARSRPTTSHVPADLGERIEAALRQAALDRLGLEARAGNLINGADRIETAARAGKVAPADPRRRRRRGRPPQRSTRPGGSAAARPQGLIFPEERTILSLALGRENVVHVALTDPAAASRVRHALARWRAFTGPDRGLEGGEPASGTGSADEI